MSEIRLTSIDSAFDIVIKYVYDNMYSNQQPYYVSETKRNLLLPPLSILRLMLTIPHFEPIDFLFDIFDNCNIRLIHQDNKYIMILEEEWLSYIILRNNHG